MSKLKALIEKYPYANKANPRYGYDWWGFECGEGWADLLDPVFAYLNEYNEKAIDTDDMIYISQIKEKFGTLRFYISMGTDEAYSLIEEAEKKSATTCEKCGAEGKIRRSGWIYTACDEHTKDGDK